MIMPVLATWYVSLMALAFVATCLFLILVVLIQKPRGGGLSGAFGGAGGGGGQTAFGAKTGDVLTWFTVACFVAFLLLAMGLTWAISPGTQPERDPGLTGEEPTTSIPLDDELPTAPAERPLPVPDEGFIVPDLPLDLDAPAVPDADPESPADDTSPAEE